MKILVVDDEAKIVKLVRSYLEQAGFAVVEAADGQTALIQARREQPDLIVLDLGKVDGFVKTGKWPWLRYRLLLFIRLILQRSQPSQ